MITQWHIAEIPESGPAIIDGKETVMYFDDISPEVMSKVVVLHNEGKTTEEIDACLGQDNGCFTDQREFIMEQISAYIKLTTVADETIVKPNTDPNNTGLQQTNNGAGTQIPTPELTRGQRAALTRKQNATNNSSPKKAGTAEAIKALEEKIQLIKLLDSAEVLEIPSGLGKDARELITSFQKEQQTLIDTYLEKVQTL